MSHKTSPPARKKIKKETSVSSNDPVKCDPFEIEYVEIKEEEIVDFYDENEIDRLADFKTENLCDQLAIKEEEIIIINDEDGIALENHNERSEPPDVQERIETSKPTSVSRSTRLRRIKSSMTTEATSSKRGRKCVYTKETFNRAVDAVDSFKMSASQASRIFDVPLYAITKHFKLRAESIQNFLGEQNDRMLVRNIRLMFQWGFSPTQVDVFGMIEKFITEERIACPFNENRPTMKWWMNFCKKYKITKLMSQETSDVRSHELIVQFFDKLNDLYQKNQLLDNPESIWNIGKISFCNDTGPLRTFNQYQRGDEKETTTIVACGNARGQVISPSIIFQGVLDTKDVPSETSNSYFSSPKGLLTSDLFHDWLQSVFLKHVGQGTQILIYDGPFKYLDFKTMELASSNHLIILKLPQFTSLKLQPLNAYGFGKFVETLNQLLTDYSKNGDTKSSRSIFSGLVSQAWEMSEWHSVLVSRFQICGLYDENQPCRTNKDVVCSQSFQPESIKKCADDVCKMYSLDSKKDEDEETVEDIKNNLPLGPRFDLEEIIRRMHKKNEDEVPYLNEEESINSPKQLAGKTTQNDQNELIQSIADISQGNEI